MVRVASAGFAVNRLDYKDEMADDLNVPYSPFNFAG